MKIHIENNGVKDTRNNGEWISPDVYTTAQQHGPGRLPNTAQEINRTVIEYRCYYYYEIFFRCIYFITT